MGVPIFRPPSVEESTGWVNKVQGCSPSIVSQIKDTSGKIWKAMTSTAGSVVTAPVAVAEGGTNLVSNIIGLPSLALQLVGKGINQVRTKTYNLLTTGKLASATS